MTSRTKNVTFPSLKKYLSCRMNGRSWSAASVPGYIVVDVVVPFGSSTGKAPCVGCDSAMGGPWSLGEASGLSERMESELIEGVFERFGEKMCLSPLQETMRVAMRWKRDKRTRVQGDLFQSILKAIPYFGSEARSARDCTT